MQTWKSTRLIIHQYINNDTHIDTSLKESVSNQTDTVAVFEDRRVDFHLDNDDCKSPEKLSLTDSFDGDVRQTSGGNTSIMTKRIKQDILVRSYAEYVYRKPLIIENNHLNSEHRQSLRINVTRLAENGEAKSKRDVFFGYTTRIESTRDRILDYLREAGVHVTELVLFNLKVEGHPLS
ncbi:hypothetical protein KUTeg_014545 [Tegillarca granosa]|uniref:TIR domain-containing protein n=1 Tax=Tegillarca granosa TaxID=220873 RepID=A0ABQ9ERP2_TEGGR|nr:hypothetical protein KUTeg_014545 [Tegillarca granosa]